MSHQLSLVSLFLTVFILQISVLQSIAIASDTNTPIIDDNIDNQGTQNILLSLMKNILEEPNSNEKLVSLNQLREHLNRMCIAGYFGSTHTHGCQRIVNIINQFNTDDDDDTNNERRGIQKRFFCNGFIGCKKGR